MSARTAPSATSCRPTSSIKRCRLDRAAITPSIHLWVCDLKKCVADRKIKNCIAATFGLLLRPFEPAINGLLGYANIVAGQVVMVGPAVDLRPLGSALDRGDAGSDSRAPLCQARG